MRILHTVVTYHPVVSGMPEAVKQLSEGLVRLGHEVTVATRIHPDRDGAPVNGVRVLGFNVFGGMVKGLTGDVDAYREFLLGSDFDVVTNFAAQQWATDVMLPLLGQVKGRKVFVPTGFSGLHQPEFSGYFESMKGWMRSYDMNVFLSGEYRDMEFARANGIGNVTVIPNGASESEFAAESDIDIRARLGIPDDHFFILHVGSHTGMKGHRELFDIFAKARIRKATLLLVADAGGGACARSCVLRTAAFNLMPARFGDRKRAVVTPLSRPETVAAYKAADLFLFPSNIECSPIVLFESLASRTPFLSSDAGNAAEIIRWTGGGGILPTVKTGDGFCRADVAGSAAALAALYGDPGKRAEMARAGFAAWRERFTWERITDEYERLYLGLLGKGRSDARPY